MTSSQEEVPKLNSLLHSLYVCPGAQYVLYPQVALNFLILIGMATEQVGWMFLLFVFQLL